MSFQFKLDIQTSASSSPLLYKSSSFEALLNFSFFGEGVRLSLSSHSILSVSFPIGKTTKIRAEY